MPKSLGDFLHDLFKKAGQDVNEAAVKDFLSNTVMTVEVPDAVVKGLDNNLLSVKDATNNHPDIKRYYTKAALDGVDSVINQLLEDMPDDIKTEINGEKSSYKRISMVAAKIKELEEKKAGAGKGDKGELQKQIDQLHSTLAAEKKAKDDLQKKFNQDLLTYRVDSQVENLVTGYKTTFDELDRSVKLATIKSLLNKELQDKDADFTFDEKGNFTLLKKDGSNFYGDNHQQVNPQQFVESLLSRNKLLVTTPKPGDTNGKPPIQPAGGGGDKPTGNATLKSLAQEALASYEKQTA
jgi:hypothetical protein